MRFFSVLAIDNIQNQLNFFKLLNFNFSFWRDFASKKRLVCLFLWEVKSKKIETRRDLELSTKLRWRWMIFGYNPSSSTTGDRQVRSSSSLPRSLFRAFVAMSEREAVRPDSGMAALRHVFRCSSCCLRIAFLSVLGGLFFATLGAFSSPVQYAGVPYITTAGSVSITPLANL